MFDDAMDLIDDDPKLEDPALYYYQGEAYLQALRFERAEDMFNRTVRLGRGMEDKAKQRWGTGTESQAGRTRNADRQAYRPDGRGFSR